jgi:hypothetical protein
LTGSKVVFVQQGRLIIQKNLMLEVKLRFLLFKLFSITRLPIAIKTGKLLVDSDNFYCEICGSFQFSRLMNAC